MLIDFYPNCQSGMNENDPRYKSLDKGEINSIPLFAFTTGYVPLYQVERPPVQLVPNYFYDKKIYIQYLIFYESLSENYLEAYNQTKSVHLIYQNE